MIKRGSLIRRMAQGRRDQEKGTTEPSGATPAISLEGLIGVEKPAPIAITPPPAPMPASESRAEPMPVPEVVDPPMPPTSESATAVPQAAPAPKGTSEKRAGGLRLGRFPGRQRGRHSDQCVRHPGESKRNAGARAWLTPEENEKLELLATAYQISLSTLTRDIILEGLEAHSELIEKTRKFLDSLGKGRASA